MGDLDLPLGLPTIPDPIDAVQDAFETYLRDTEIGAYLDVPLNRYLELNRAIRDGMIEGIEMSGLRIDTALVVRVTGAMVAHYEDYVLGLVDGFGAALRDLATAIAELGVLAWGELSNEIGFDRVETLLTNAADFLLDTVRVKKVATMIALDSAREVAALAKATDPEDIARRFGRIMGQVALELVMAFFSGGLSQILKRSPRFVRMVRRYERLMQKLGLGSARRDGRMGAQAAGRGTRRRNPLDRDVDRGLSEEASYGSRRDPKVSERPVKRSGSKSGKRFTTLNSVLKKLTPDRLKILMRLVGKFPDELRKTWKTAGTDRALALARKRNDKVRKLWKKGKFDEARKLARRNYENYRRRFWKKVRADKQLREMFEKAGMSFDGRPGSAPYWQLPGGGIERLTLEHKDRVMDVPWKSIDPDNFLLVPARENSNMLEFLRGKDPFQIYGPNAPMP